MKIYNTSLDRVTGQTIMQIPFFQRHYVWSLDNWEKLFDSLLGDEDCFLGSIILKQSGQLNNSGNRIYYELIDGQQRMTTLSIFIRALNDCTFDDRRLHDPFKKLLFYTYEPVYNRQGGSTDFIRLEHSAIDRISYGNVINGNWIDDDLTHYVREDVFAKELEGDSADSMRICYNYFRWRIERIDDTTKDNILRKLTDEASQVFIFMYLEGENPQRIFDVINSTGVKLTCSDIIKNYIYEKYKHVLVLDENFDENRALSKAVDFYERTWKDVFEKDSDCVKAWIDDKGNPNNETKIDHFFYAYSVIKDWFEDNDKTSKLADVFKRELDRLRTSEEIEGFVTEIVAYARVYYTNFLCDYARENTGLGITPFTRVMTLIDACNQRKYDAFMLWVEMNGNFDENDRNTIYGRFESWFVNGTLLGEIVSRSSVRDSVRPLISGYDSVFDSIDIGSAQTRIGEALNCLTNDNLAKFILYFIEYDRRPVNGSTTLCNFCDYELEHIMPRKWEENWSGVAVYDVSGNIVQGNEESRNERKSAVFRIGNMLLLQSKPNIQFSNRNFAEKQHGFVNGRGRQVAGYNSVCNGLYIYNSLPSQNPVSVLNEWDERNINSRTDELVRLFFEIWS